MIKAWTKARADSWDRYFRIRRIFYKWKNPDLPKKKTQIYNPDLQANDSMLPTLQEKCFFGIYCNCQTIFSFFNSDQCFLSIFL